MFRTTVVVVLLMLALLPGGSVGGHGTDHFVTSGELSAGNPTSDFLGGVSEITWGLTGSQALDGVDGEVVELPAWAPGHPLWVNGSSPVSYDLDVWFYDEDRGLVSSGDELEGGTCATISSDELCLVPAGAAYAVVDLWLGADVTFTLEVHAVPDSGGGGDGGNGGAADAYAIPTWFTWEDLSLDVKVLPPASGPIYNQDLTVLPGGLGVAADSPYVDATLEAVEAFEEAIDGYVAANPDATHLQRLSFDVGVVGRDATVEEFERADIRIMYGPTGANALGVAIATETSGGRFIQCDIVNFQWLIYSFEVNDVYNIHGQEFGHCLGLSHPNDEAEHPDPPLDIMNGIYPFPIGDPDTPRLCVSNLDVRGLDLAYHWRANGTAWQPPQDLVLLQPDDYVRYPAVGTADACPDGS